MADAIRPVHIYFIADGSGPPAFDAQIADDDNRYSFDGWLPLALEESGGSFKVTAVGDNWLTAPHGSGQRPLDAGPVEIAVSAADCASELAARLHAGVRHYSGEWDADSYNAANDRRWVAAEIAATLRPLLTRLEEEQELIEGLTITGLDHLEIDIETVQFMEADKRLGAQPSGEQGMYTRAVEEFVKTNHAALVEHLERKTATTREQIHRVMHAVTRLRAFEPMDAHPQ